MGTPDQEVVKAIEEKAGFTGNALLVAKVLTDAAEAYIEHGGNKIPTSIKIFRGGLWETVNIPLNVAQGDVTSLAITKAIVGAATGIGIAALATAATSGAPFIIGFGAAFAFGIYAGGKISEAVEYGYDTIIGPDFTYIEEEKKITVDYGLYDAIKADAGWSNNESFKGILQAYNLSQWTLISEHAVQGGRIEFSNNTFEFVGQSLSTLKQDGSYLEAVVEKLTLPDQFNVKITGGSTYGVTNIFKKTESQIASLAKSDTDVLQALVQMKSYAINDDDNGFVNFGEYSNAYINDRAKMLYWYNMSKWHKLGMTKVNAELSADDLHFTDMLNDIEFGGHDLIFDYGKKITFGTFGADTIEGGDLDDKLYGDDGSDTLIGNGGNDWLEGGKGGDILLGGEGTDTYISGNMDIITDTDGKGWVYFEGKLLHGGTKQAGAGCGTGPDGSEEYYGDGGIYRLSGSTLTFTKDGKILTINDYQNTQLHITLKDNEGDNGACPSPTPDAPCPKPVNPVFNFNFSLPTPTRSVSYGGGSGGGGSYGGGGGGSSYIHYSPSTPHRTPTPPIPDIPCPHVDYYNSAGTGGGGGGTPPIVLDLNRNGITSISLVASKALFDYDGDSVLENTAWIENSDALLVNDINNDGLINNATELFGNYTKNSDGSIAKSGYQALSYYDTNNDGVVNSSDTRFNELKLWIDANQDGTTDAGELKTLQEMGVTSLKLNGVSPYIPTTEATNTIIQETSFTDANGEGIMRDVLFRYENTSTNKAINNHIHQKAAA